MTRLGRALAWSAAIGWAGGCFTPSSIESHYNRGVDAYARGDLASAITEFGLELELRPQNHKAWYNLALAYDRQGQSGPAERGYRKVLELQPANAPAHISLAALLQEQGKPDEALRHLEQATQAAPDRAYPLAALGYFHERRGDPARARELYRQAAAREPTHVESNYRLGRLLLETNDVDGALQYLEAALRVDPDDVPSLTAAARCYARKQERVKAILALQRAELRAARIEPALYLELADLLEAEGRLEDALRYVWNARDAGAPEAQTEPRRRRILKSMLE
jgi:tetratricopeptide (TPR) repeat protein